MNILFFIYHGFSATSGISKKIQYQIKGLRECGHRVDVCTYLVNKDQHRVRMINEQIIQDYGTGCFAAIRKRFDYSGIVEYVRTHTIDFIYVRSFHNANPFTVHLFKKLKKAGIKMVMEIPTYPYDQEYQGYSLRNRMGLKIDKLFRHQLAKQFNAIITFTNDKQIFNQRTICISNGIDFENIQIQQKKSHPDNELHLTGVAEVHYWHGFDRLIAGLGDYYTKTHDKEVFFHIIGGVAHSEMYNSRYASGFSELITKYGIQKQVIFHGPLYGKQLEDILNQTDFAIGSLARHRSGITQIKTLKNREYAARGIPFIYSETDEDFEQMPYIIKAQADESPINIKQIINFCNEHSFTPEEIRNSILHLSWKKQMEKVIKEVFQ